jgi:hypothetical protein
MTKLHGKDLPHAAGSKIGEAAVDEVAKMDMYTFSEYEPYLSSIISSTTHRV